MKTKILLAAVCSAGLLTACNQSTDQASTAAKTDSDRPATVPEMNEPTTGEMDVETLLTVNGEAITRTMYSLYFQDRMRNVPDAQNSPEMQMSVLNELSNIIIVAQDAEKQGILKRPEVAASVDLLKAKLLTQIAIQDFASNHEPSEEDVQKAYQEDYAGQSGNEYKARHILVKEQDEATTLIEKLDGGADFAELAVEHSTGPTGKNGGDLGWFDVAQMVKPFGDALKNMEKGKYSTAPVETQFGWHVILLEDTRDTEAPTLDSVKGKIVNKLKQVALSDYMQGLRDSSKLVFNEKNAKPAPAADPSAAAPGAAPAGEAPASDSATPSMEANAEMDKPAEAAK
ncbi:MAG: peptidylprolyl isomerase [Candidatus Thiodiazotropha endolucinida]|nr:peptidylprolyl isomerase [Candidatus Thiodiazotropha taylori]MCG8096622.1 peptidylprolyl isomerase [Candidatus Thiodiazotropha endolucinida]MCG8060102.1 peptidylprolyl isomerase [Candidatus Thiodiazotropha taylori]MCG8064879.1 peptidylprolyl isomerase [Candidatus Thiodiazotropha taylori]MCW4330970.1 peptidylprolyl isomerase [Candidatus Thiodiazotropha endolucinida]